MKKIDMQLTCVVRPTLQPRLHRRRCVMSVCTVAYTGGVQEVSVGDQEQDQDSAADQDERRWSGSVVAGGRRGVRG